MRWYFLIVLLAAIACTPSKREADTTSTVAAINDLPTLPITLTDSTRLNVRELPGNTILILYLSDCDHCQREAESIKEKIKAFKSYTIYFISHEPADVQLKFAEKYGLTSEPNVKFARTTFSMIVSNFGAIATPSVYIYSSEKRLVKQFNGETNIEEIIKFL